MSAAVQAALIKHLGGERDQVVIGAICWTLGRLPYGTAQAARSAEVALLVASLPLDARREQPHALQFGVARGFESLLRRHAKLFTPSQETVRRLRQMALERRKPRRGDEAEDDDPRAPAGVAALSSARQADERTIAAAVRRPRRPGAPAGADGPGRRPARVVSEAARARLMAAGLADADYLVRYEALRLHARSLIGAFADWAPVFTALGDPSTACRLVRHRSALGAAAEIARPRAVNRSSLLPRSLRRFPAPAGRGGLEWHRAAHALVSLARLAPEEAAALLSRFEGSTLHWPVRMYAARAAATGCATPSA